MKWLQSLLFVFIVSFYLNGRDAQATSSDELETLLSLQPRVQDLTPTASHAFKLLGRGVTAQGVDSSLAMACTHLDYPKDISISPFSAFFDLECNTFQVIYFTTQGAYTLSLPISSEENPSSPHFLSQAAYRLFHNFVTSLKPEVENKITQASFDQKGWNWNELPVEVKPEDYLKAVIGIHNLLSPKRLQSQNQIFMFLPLTNWRIWNDWRYPNLITLFL